MGKKSRREAQKAEEARQALATTKAAEARAAKRTLAAAKAEEAKGTLATASFAVMKAADTVAEVGTQAAEERIVQPVVAAVKKPKKARFVREQAAKKPVAKDAALPPRSTTAAGKMMSMNVTLPQKEVRTAGPKDERATGPKPKA